MDDPNSLTTLNMLEEDILKRCKIPSRSDCFKESKYIQILVIFKSTRNYQIQVILKYIQKPVILKKSEDIIS